MPLLHASPVQYYIGPQLIGSLFNAALYTLEVVAVNIYRRSIQQKNERAYIKVLVIFNLFIDTIGTFAVCAGVYTFCVIFWGNNERATRPHWTLVLSVLTNSIVAFTVQGFLTYRYWRISSNWFIALGILALMLFTFSATLHLVIISANPHRSALDRLKDVRDVSMALAGSVATDITINTALCFKLFNLETFNHATKILIKRIITLAIATGVATSLVVIVILTAFLISPLSRISTCFSLFLGRVYSLTMLYTLLHRESLDRHTPNVIDTSDTIHTTPETDSRSGTFSSRGIFSHSEGIIFARHDNYTPSDRSHSTSEITTNTTREANLPKRTISCQSYVPYQSKNDPSP